MAFNLQKIQGRNGKGAIYLFAAGNGETSYDNCNADGYVNSIYTIAVTSVGQGQNAWYAEVCAAALTAAYGGGDGLKLVNHFVNCLYIL